MKLLPAPAPVNAGSDTEIHDDRPVTPHDPRDIHGPAQGFVDIAFTLPSALWELLKDASREELASTDDIVTAALTDHFARRTEMKRFEERNGFDVEELRNVIHIAGTAAVLEAMKDEGDIAVPLTFAVVPSGMAPVFIEKRDARFHREVCGIANVDPDKYVADWVHQMVDDGLNGEYDVDFAGLTQDVVAEFDHEDGAERSPQEKDALYEKLREVAFRYQQELKLEAAASEEGGAL